MSIKFGVRLSQFTLNSSFVKQEKYLSYNILSVYYSVMVVTVNVIEIKIAHIK